MGMLSSRIAVEAVKIENVSERIMNIYLTHACRLSIHASNVYTRRHDSRTHVRELKLVKLEVHVLILKLLKIIST